MKNVYELVAEMMGYASFKHFMASAELAGEAGALMMFEFELRKELCSTVENAQMYARRVAEGAAEVGQRLAQYGAEASSMGMPSSSMESLTVCMARMETLHRQLGSLLGAKKAAAGK